MNLYDESNVKKRRQSARRRAMFSLLLLRSIKVRPGRVMNFSGRPAVYRPLREITHTL